jgi:hypothetical protein
MQNARKRRAGFLPRGLKVQLISQDGAVRGPCTSPSKGTISAGDQVDVGWTTIRIMATIPIRAIRRRLLSIRSVEK